MVLVFFSKSLASGISGVYSPTAKNKDMKKEAKAYNMFFFGVGGGSKKLIQIFQAPMMSEFSCLTLVYPGI